jgi:hypothetical protein
MQDWLSPEAGALLMKNKAWISVELDAYSGIPNPRWEVYRPNLENIVSTLMKISDNPHSLTSASSIPDLGYRGLIVTIDVGTRLEKYRIKDGIASDASGKAALVPGMESFIVSTAPAEIREEIKNISKIK